MDLGEDGLLLLLKLVLVHEDGERVNAGGHVLEADAVVLERLKSLAAETDLRVHHVLLDVDRGEALLTRDTGDRERRLAGSIFHDKGTLVLRTVGVLDVDRNACRADREDRVLVENACAHIRELAKLAVGDRLDDAGIVHDMRIGYEETGHIGPVLIQVRMYGAGHDGTGDVGTAAGERLHAPVRIRSVKAGNYGVVQILKHFGEQVLRCLRIEGAVLEETDISCGIDEFETEVICNKNTVQVLTAGSRVIATGMCRKILTDRLKLSVERNGQRKTVDDLLIASADLRESLGKISVLLGDGIAVIEHIRDFRVGAVALARRGRNDKTTVGIG